MALTGFEGREGTEEEELGQRELSQRCTQWPSIFSAVAALAELEVLISAAECRTASVRETIRYSVITHRLRYMGIMPWLHAGRQKHR